MPVTRLKSVVLPAPFGPITLTISRSSTSRSSSWIAYRPPKLFETARSSSRPATSASPREYGAPCVLARLAFRAPGPSAHSRGEALDDLHPRGSEQALRARVHQRDEQRTEEDKPRHARLLGQPVLPDEGSGVE